MISAMRNILTNDLGWKLFSLALATLIWFTVRHETTAPAMRTFANVPVLAVSAGADVREFKLNPDVVRVTISGRPSAVAALEQKDIHVIVDLTGVPVSADLVKRVDVSVPAGVTVVRVVPAGVSVVVPPKWEKANE